MKNHSLLLVFPLAMAMAFFTVVEANAQSGSRSAGPSFGAANRTASPQLPSRSFTAPSLSSPSFSARSFSASRGSTSSFGSGARVSPQAYGSSTRSVRPSSTYSPPTGSFRTSRAYVAPTQSRSIPQSVRRQPVYSPLQSRSCSSGLCGGY